MNDLESPRTDAGPARSKALPRTLFALTDAGGTVPPELGVARRYVDRGHQVTVLADESMTGQVRQTGAQSRPWTGTTAGSMATLRDWDARSPLALARATIESMVVGPAPDQAGDTSEALAAAHPDLVLTSFGAFGAMIAAEAQGVPFDVLLPNIYPMPAHGMPPGGGGLAPARGPLGRLRDSIMKGAAPRLVDHFALARINALRAEYRLDPLRTTWDQVHHARRQLLLTSAAFDFAGTLPRNAHYVGPILDDPSWASDAVWVAPPGDDHLVLVAMSSTFQNHVECMQRIVDALGTLPVRGVVTTGPAVRSDAIRAPANVTVIGSAPHADVMRQASLVVTHGGHGTVIKSLAAGLPLVILHHGRDQADNAVRVTTRGAGLAISRRSSTPKISRAIAEVLSSPRYRQAAQQLGEAVARDAENSSRMLFAEYENELEA